MRALLLLLVLAAPLAAAQTPDALAGEWRLTGSATQRPAPTGDYIPARPPAPFRLAFTDAGDATVEAGVELRHTFDGDTLALRPDVDSDVEHVAARIAADTLTITDPDDGTALVFVREGGAASDGLIGRWLRPDAGMQAESGPPGGFEFDPDGTGRAFYVATMRYSVERGMLHIGGPLSFAANVRVAGDRLTLVQKYHVSRYVRAGTARVVTPAAGPSDGPVVVLERTPCYGRCPAYRVAAYADGRVVWAGERHVAAEGPTEWRVAPAIVAGLVRQAEAAFHGSFPAMLSGGDVCPEFVTDHPGAVTTVRTAAGTHEVTHNLGCSGLIGLAALTDFEESIDRDLGTASRVGRPDPVRGVSPTAPR